jgi:hypothetical protein
MPIFRPTDEEFKNPIEYLEKLFTQNRVQEYGCIKIIPPKSF